MHVKGAIGLVISAVTLTGRSYHCLTLFAIDDTASIISSTKNIWTLQPLQKLTMVFVVKLLNFLLRDFWMLEMIKSIRQLYYCHRSV